MCAHETFVLKKAKNEIGEKNNQISFCFNGENATPQANKYMFLG